MPCRVTDDAIVAALRDHGPAMAEALKARLGLAPRANNKSFARRLERLAAAGRIVEVAVLVSPGRRGTTTLWGARDAPPPVRRRAVAGECPGCTCATDATAYRTDPFTGLLLRVTPCQMRATA